MKTDIKTINGFECYYINKGIYSFSKKTKKGYLEIECTEEQLTNGDIEFMTLHGLSINNSRKKLYQNKYQNK